MTTANQAHKHPRSQMLPAPEGELARGGPLGRVSESTTVQGMVGVAMVGLLGGGPRLAMRAARVVLQDSYGWRHPASRGRLRGRVRHRGD
jgi:hypothetical protein